MSKIVAILAAGLLIGAMAAQAKLPPPPPKSDEQKKAEADKDAATKAQDAAELTKAQDKAVANYKKNQASMGKETSKAKK